MRPWTRAGSSQSAGFSSSMEESNRVVQGGAGTNLAQEHDLGAFSLDTLDLQTSDLQRSLASSICPEP